MYKYTTSLSVFGLTPFEYLVKPREPGNQGNMGTREPGNQGNQGNKGIRGTREQMFLFIS